MNAAIFITVVALLCHKEDTRYCVEEIITNSDAMPGMTVQRCEVSAQANIAMWMSRSEKYSEGWTLGGYQCYEGHYILKDAI